MDVDTGGERSREPKAPLVEDDEDDSARTILVVDDEHVVRRTAKLSLENAGFQVRVADSGDEAIHLLRSGTRPEISLVLVDLNMPDMGGVEVVRVMREAGISLPVLMMSGYSVTEFDSELTGLNIAGFVQKPFTARQLANRVAEALGGPPASSR